MNTNLFDNILGILWRSLIVGIGNMVALTAAGRIFQVGTSSPGTHENAISFLWIFLLSGILIGLTLGPVASQMAASRSRHFFIWGCVVFLNLVSVVMEGIFFAPGLLSRAIPNLIFQQLLTALVTSILITILFVPSGKTQIIGTHRPWYAWIWRFVVSSLSYVFFYFIFGAINYALVTKPYYETHVGSLTMPAPEVVVMTELMRAPLIVLSILPVVLTLRTTRRLLAFICGTILFVVGGVIPLLMQVNTLPIFLLVASGWEIFFQNFLTGVIVAIMLGER